MTREDIAWIIVRAFGVYFAYNIVLYVFSFVMLSINLVQMSSQVDNASESFGAMDSTIRMSWFRLGTLTIQILLQGLFAYYCLWRGRLLHRVLAHGADAFERP